MAIADILSSVVSALQDDSSEVRRRALSALKSVAKVCCIDILMLFNNVLIDWYEKF